LHVLRCYRNSQEDPTITFNSRVPQGANAVAEKCIQCARHSYHLLSEAWIHGSFAILDYFKTQFLFSSATVLAISSLLGGRNSRTDAEYFQTAGRLLEQLDQSGSLAAREYNQHVAAIKLRLADVALKSQPTERAETVVGRCRDTLQPSDFPTYDPHITAGMALIEPSFQDLLTQDNLDLQSFDPTSFDAAQSLYWPELWDESWTG